MYKLTWGLNVDTLFTSPPFRRLAGGSTTSSIASESVDPATGTGCTVAAASHPGGAELAAIGVLRPRLTVTDGFVFGVCVFAM